MGVDSRGRGGGKEGERELVRWPREGRRREAGKRNSGFSSSNIPPNHSPNGRNEELCWPTHSPELHRATY